MISLACFPVPASAAAVNSLAEVRDEKRHAIKTVCRADMFKGIACLTGCAPMINKLTSLCHVQYSFT